ncbi:MAG: restriction endonuclease [Burkholderiaceae bacterium]|nr:restriction endonuclease [Burkholderiaceae bacterium]
MKKYQLGFISDKAIFEHVKSTVLKYRFVIDLETFNSNIVDPIKLTFDAKVYNKTIEQVIQDEVTRQLDKSNNNHIGYFHQNLFGLLNADWTVPSKGFDVVNEKQKIFVEMKNKHNTMNSSSSQKTYTRMQAKLLNTPKAQCFLVEVIAKKSQNQPWIVSLDGERVVNDKIRRVSIDKFYEFITGDGLAFHKLCTQLPVIIDDVIEHLGRDNLIKNTVLSELCAVSSQDILKRIYKLSFKDYQGFRDE